ncbi:MAG: cytochrome P450 [Polyangia bacterium]
MRSLAIPQKAPGPSLLATLGCMSAFRSDPLAFLRDMHARYGDVVRLPLGLQVVSVLHPDAVRHVLVDNHRNYEKGQDYERLEVVLGKGLLTSNGAIWKRHRRLAQPAFHKQRLAGFAQVMLERTQQRIEMWRDQAAGAPGRELVVDLHAEMMALTLQIVGECLFSTDLSAVTHEIGLSLGEVLRLSNEYVSALVPLPLWIPTPFSRRFRSGLATLDAAVKRLIGARLRAEDAAHAQDAAAGPGSDLLGMLLAAHLHPDAAPAAENGAEPGVVALSVQELRDEVMTLLLAGHETTANALTFGFLLLTENPAAAAALLRESARVLGDRIPGLEDLPALAYNKQVIEETLRLYPPAWAIGRRALAEDRIGGHAVAAGTHVLLAPMLTQRDPRFFPEPLRFVPERFAKKESAARPAGAYFPFAAGPRQCIGLGFAMMELQLILPTLLRSVEITALEPDALRLEPLITLRPADGLRCRIRFRS